MAKVSEKKTAAKSKQVEESTSKPRLSVPKFNPSISSIKAYRPTKQTYIIVFVIGLLLLGYYKKGWIVAATVNGSPVSNYELLSRINSQYRTQTLNQMVNEKIILDEASKKGVKISQADINNKLSEIEKNVGGAQALDSLLTQQGQTRDMLNQQLKLQVTIEKLYAGEATISAQEIQAYVTDNKEQLTATTAAEQTKEAEEVLKQQKLAKIFNTKFQELKQQAKVLIF